LDCGDGAFGVAAFERIKEDHGREKARNPQKEA
jgi:hypothetical protein